MECKLLQEEEAAGKTRELYDEISVMGKDIASARRYVHLSSDTCRKAWTTVGSTWVPLPPHDFFPGKCIWPSGAIGAVGSNGIQGVCDCENARTERDGSTRQLPWISFAVPALLVCKDNFGGAFQKWDAFQNALTPFRMVAQK